MVFIYEQIYRRDFDNLLLETFKLYNATEDISKKIIDKSYQLHKEALLKHYGNENPVHWLLNQESKRNEFIEKVKFFKETNSEYIVRIFMDDSAAFKYENFMFDSYPKDFGKKFSVLYSKINKNDYEEIFPILNSDKDKDKDKDKDNEFVYPEDDEDYL